jgi:hypothetical protein
MGIIATPWRRVCFSWVTVLTNRACMHEFEWSPGRSIFRLLDLCQNEYLATGCPVVIGMCKRDEPESWRVDVPAAVSGQTWGRRALVCSHVRDDPDRIVDPLVRISSSPSSIGCPRSKVGLGADRSISSIRDLCVCVSTRRENFSFYLLVSHFWHHLPHLTIFHLYYPI